MPFETGPHIQVAAFCEQVIEEKTGVLSLIRLIDTVTQTESGSEPPAEMPPLTWRMKLVLALKPDRARGRHEIKLVPEQPSGETKEPMQLSVNLEGEERGQNIIFDMVFTFAFEGLYWFNVFFDDTLFTKMPFRVKYQRIIQTRKLV